MSYADAILIILAAGAVSSVVTIVIQHRIAIEFRRHHHEVGSVVFLQLGVVFAVLLAFVFSEAWDEYNAAAQAIDLEVGALHGTAMIANTFPAAQAEEVLEAERSYIKSVIDSEWQIMARSRTEDADTDQKLGALIGDVANLRLPDPNDRDKKSEVLTLLAQAHEEREIRIFQAHSGIPIALWCVLIAFTVVLALFVSFSGIAYAGTSIAIAACFASGIVSILVIGRLLDYPFEGALALRPTDFIELLGKVSALLHT